MKDPMSLSIDNVLSFSAKTRLKFKSDLTFIERLELCGIWAVSECVEFGCDDESIAVMFDSMKIRMMKQAPTIRAAMELTK